MHYLDEICILVYQFGIMGMGMLVTFFCNRELCVAILAQELQNSFASKARVMKLKL